MAWVAVDKNGTEAVFSGKPERYSYDNIGGIWYDFYGKDVRLPSGSIEKLIGRKLTWEDEPVELTDVSKQREQLIAFLRQQSKLHYITIYENDFEFADKLLKAINRC